VEAIIIKKKSQMADRTLALIQGWACGCDYVPLAIVKDQTIIDAKYFKE
jgi:hypothetical protein